VDAGPSRRAPDERADARETGGDSLDARGRDELRRNGRRDGGTNSDAQDARPSCPRGAVGGAGGARMTAMSPIDPRLQEALDGERDPGTLPVDLREAYARLMGAANLLQTIPATSVAARVMAEIHDLKPEVENMRPAR